MTSCAKKDIAKEIKDYSEANGETFDNESEAFNKGFSKFTVNWYGDQYLPNGRTSSGVQSDVEAAVQSIIDETNLNDFDVIAHWNSWDSHFTVMTQLPEDEINDLLEELKDEVGGGSKGYSVLGITYKRSTDSNGVAYKGGSYAMADCDPNSSWLVDWPDKSLYMHELCHNLNCPDHGWYSCVMNYISAAQGKRKLCYYCKKKINSFIK